jgi:hypothetical protein
MTNDNRRMTNATLPIISRSFPLSKTLSASGPRFSVPLLGRVVENPADFPTLPDPLASANARECDVVHERTTRYASDDDQADV